jgi:hypothetical protein
VLDDAHEPDLGYKSLTCMPNGSESDMARYMAAIGVELLEGYHRAVVG